MRSLLLVAFLATLACVALGSSVAPDAAVMEEPQLEDVTLLQMDSQARTTTSQVAALESQLAAALASQHQIESDLAAEQAATVGAEAQVDSEQLVELEAQQAQQAGSVVEGAAELEAEFEAEAEVEMDLDSDAEAESAAQVDVDAEVDTELDAEVDADAENETETELDAEAETDVDAEAETESEVDTDADAEEEDASPVHRPRFAQKEEKDEEDKPKKDGKKAKAKKAAKKAKKAAKAKARKEEKAAKKAAKAAKKADAAQAELEEAKQMALHARNPKAQREARDALKRAKRHARQAAFKAGMRVERSDNNAPPDVVHLPNGKKLYKSWVVSPNLKLEAPKAKVVPRHSKERVMTKFEMDHFSRLAGLRENQTQKHSAIRRAFLRLNPRLRKAGLRRLRKRYLRNLRRRSFSPAHAWGRALRAGKFNSLRFDPPSITKNGGTSTQIVSQQLTVRQHAPSVRQRAEVSALRAATRTLRRINAKRREYKKALKSLQQARDQISKQIHQHHVARALQAKKVAARAQRRAAWSALLQHRSLRQQLLKDIARAIRKGHLTGEARKKAIAALIKRNLTPAQRRRLHSYIKGRSGRAHRHAARRERHNKRAARRRARRNANKKNNNKQVGAVQKNGNSVESSKASAKRVGAVQKNGNTVESSKAAAKRVGAAAPAVSDKDQKAIDALIQRIKAAINHPDTPRRHRRRGSKNSASASAAAPAVPEVGAVQKNGQSVESQKAAAKRVGAAAPVSTTQKHAASTASPKASAIRVGAAAPASTQAKTAAASESSKAAKRPVTPIRFQQMSSAARIAAEAEADALSQLNTETEIDDFKDAPVLQLEAQVAAASGETEELLHQYHLE